MHFKDHKNKEYTDLGVIINDIEDGIVVINYANVVTYSNQKAKQDFNVEEGKAWNTVFPNALLRYFRTLLPQVKTTQQMTEFEFYRDTKSQWYGVLLFPSKQNVTIQFRNITKEKKIKQDIDSTYQDLLLLSETSEDIIYSQEPKALLDLLFQKLPEYLHLDVYLNYMVDSSGSRIHLTNYSGIDWVRAKELEYLNYGETVCGKVAQDCKRIVVENVHLKNDRMTEVIKNLEIKSYVCHPLIASGELIGTLSFGSKTRTHFAPNEIQLIEKISNQVAVNLERSILIYELKQKNKQLEENNKLLQTAKEEAERANKAKTTFLSMMSHEFRTPPNAVIGFSELLLSDKVHPLGKKQKDRSKKILDSSEHLLNMINDMIELARWEKGTPKIAKQPVNIKKVLDEAVAIMQPAAIEKAIEIEDHTEADNKIVFGDGTKLIQAFTNVIANAINYSGENGKIQISSNIKDRNITFRIKDHGKGIPEEELSHIFKPFYRIDKLLNRPDGMGIGLTLVEQIVADMDGSIDVQSSLGEGSSFCITLPIKEKEDVWECH